MEDIKDRTDIELLVNNFYDKVRADQTIGFIFTDVATVDWTTHLPKMYSFWETVLLGKMSFKGNPMDTHIKLSQKTEMSEKHFNQWLTLWNETVDELFIGKIATEAKQRGKNIAGLMVFKIGNYAN
ncbi:group III truncated hemoglobin [Leeuwenhoekiella sp. A16]|uniref:group III truncated hemoglobin n=1 Tax=unclassified Leeuwenhoekiella TaxID=2615029 RepID=UPI000C4F6417|nr:sec-independent protein translocase TatC [Cytophagaceae bacterium]|tara:strand:- start:2240 stop:2617 length:378 start_codon:yes stop_codon:yes gene_type:complete